VVDFGAALEVEMIHGTLASTSDAALLNGDNLIAIGDGSPDNWELFQFRDAELIAPGRYLLGHRLRDQLGSDAVGPPEWPEGSWIVVMNGAPAQIDLARSLRRVAQTYRVGPARRSYDDPSYEEFVHAFDGNGLRPYRPVHLRAVPEGADLAVSWIRRTRLDGDDWDLPDVPLGEDIERYTVRILQGRDVIRETVVETPVWSYDAAARQSDGLTGAYQIAVAQNSARYGPGPFAVLEVAA